MTGFLAQETTNRTHPEKSTPRHSMMKLVKSKDQERKKKNPQKQPEKNDVLFIEEQVLNDCRILIRNHGGQRR